MVSEHLSGRRVEKVGLCLCILFVELLFSCVRGVDLFVGIRSDDLKN